MPYTPETKEFDFYKRRLAALAVSGALLVALQQSPATPARLPVAQTPILSAQSGTFAESKMAAEFRRLASSWENATSDLSAIDDIVGDPSYRQIVAMGAAALPFIFAELQREPDHWFPALLEITGQNPVPQEMAGQVYAMTAAWIEWGIANNYA